MILFKGILVSTTLLICISCNTDPVDCVRNTDAELSKVFSIEDYFKDRIEFPPFSTDSNIVRYRYYSEGEHLALNLVIRNDQYVLQVFEELGRHQRTSIYKEIQLTASQIEQLLSKIEKVKCLPYDLDPYGPGLHVNRYLLTFNHEGSFGAITWRDVGERSRDAFGNEAVNPFKRLTQDLSSYLIRLTGLPLSEKGIVLKDSFQNDSLQYEVFIKRGYVAIDFTVLFDGQVWEHDEFYVTKLMVHKSDTIDIKNLVKIREIQWGDSISVY